MPHDDLDHIPSIVPSRDGVPQRSASKAKTGGERARSTASARQPTGSAGTGVLTKLLLAAALVIAAAACGWAWQLQTQLREADGQLENYAKRIGDLEARLSDTDEGMNQSAQVQAVKIGELEKEVRKLWDNVWKESKERLGKLEASSATQAKSVSSMSGSVSSLQSQFKNTSAEIAKLKSVSADLARLMTSAKANQAEVERVADDLNRINLAMAKLDRRVAGNEEWVASMNAFRRQVNTSLSELQAAVRSMKSAPQ